MQDRQARSHWRGCDATSSSRRRCASQHFFLNIPCIGLVAWDYELTNSELADVGLFEMVANRHRDILCGVKVRMGATTVGSNGVEPVRRAIQAAERCDMPIMVHIAHPPPSIEEFLPLLRAGDIITHCAPARILGYEDRGTLRIGALADIALFQLHEGAFPLYDSTGTMRSGRQLLRNAMTIVGGRILERPAASPRAVWMEHWDRGGTNARIRALQCELVARGHTPGQMCGCGTTASM
jgi:predicted amidohydrolase